jgi:hypothetical protein
MGVKRNTKERRRGKSDETGSEERARRVVSAAMRCLSAAVKQNQDEVKVTRIGPRPSCLSSTDCSDVI